MIYVDRVMLKRQVLHRHNAAGLCSRATVMRRIRDGEWWRPTSRTVALRTEFPDPDFEFLVAAANVWPNGGVAGACLPFLFGLTQLRPQIIESTIPRPRHLPDEGMFRIRRRSTAVLASHSLASGRQVAIDVSPGSLLDASGALTVADLPWLLIHSLREAKLPNQRRDRMRALASQLGEVAHPHRQALVDIAAAVADGCESAGEAYVWILLVSLGVRFSTQREFSTKATGGTLVSTSSIRTDFLLIDYDIVVEVDSALHDHVKDIRRDLWNLEAGRRTVRIVGRDVVIDPERGRADLIRSLAALGVRMSPGPLPAWLQLRETPRARVVNE